MASGQPDKGGDHQLRHPQNKGQSALVRHEPDAELYEQAIANAEAASMSAATVLECSLVLERRYGSPGVQKLDQLLSEKAVTLVDFDQVQMLIARAAYRRFGRGRHPAQLNFGDCFAYALAKHLGEPLLFKGRDFAQTDVTSAL